MNYKLGGVGFEGHAIICGVGAVYYLVLSIMYMAQKGLTFSAIDPHTGLFKAAMWGAAVCAVLSGTVLDVEQEPHCRRRQR